MTDLLSVTIDAGVLAVPHIDCTKEDVYQYIDTLLNWKELLEETWLAIYMSERASESLDADGLYPVRPCLKNLFKTHGIVEYDENTVAPIVDHLLGMTPSFETRYHLKDVLFEQLKTEPDVIQQIPHNALQADLARCITLISILCKHCEKPLGGHSIVLKKAPKQGGIQIQAQIHEIEHGRDDIPELPSPPDLFKGEIFVCDSFNGLVECLDEGTILHGASDDLGIELAIRISLFKDAIHNKKQPDWDNAIIPKIGSKFRKFCQTCFNAQGASLSNRILRSVTETINNENMRDVHPFRTGPGGNDPQKLRGLDKAQRRDIDREYHLHYWECPNGTIELASVGNHDFFSIPE